MLGKRRLLAISLPLFAAGSVLSAVGTSLEVIVAGRALQGLGGGIFPLSFGIIRDEFPADRVPASVGLLGAPLASTAGSACRSAARSPTTPRSTAFTAALAISAVGSLVAAVAALSIPARRAVRAPEMAAASG
jgi:MFS family permease